MKLRHGLVGAAIMIIGVPFLAPALGNGLASAQQVRALQDGVEVKLDPSDSSPAIATLAAGATLDWIGESGPYHIVSIPGDPGEEDLIGYVLASEVEVVGDASAGVQGSLAGTGIPDMQGQYARSKARRSSGVSKVLWGGTLAALATAATQIVFDVGNENAYADSASHQAAVDRHSVASTAKDVVTLLGAGLITWGVADYFLGWRNMGTLEGELPTLADPAMEDQYRDANRKRGSGKRKVFWGVALAGGSYAALKWVPWLGVPEPADHDEEWEYLSAVHRRDRAETANKWFMGLGAVLGVWGMADWMLGSMKMSEIEAVTRVAASPAPQGAPAAQVGPDLFVRRAAGRTEIGLAWNR